MTPPTWAVIPSAGRDLLHDCIASLTGQVDRILVIANGPLRGRHVPGAVTINAPDDQPNISRWWNLGLDYYAAALGEPAWNVLIVNDDVTLENGAVRILATTLRRTRAALAFPGPREQLLTEPTLDRITGYAFMLAGETGLRADETFAWWYGDNDLDYRARGKGGSVTVPGVGLLHHDPNGYTNRIPQLATQAAHDRQTFLSRWGRLPH